MVSLALWLVCLTSAETASSKMPASKVTTEISPTGDVAVADETMPEPPRALLNGEAIDAPITASPELNGRTVHLRPLHDELQLTYVHGLVDPSEIDEMVRLAGERGGWARSPLKSQGSGDRLSKDDRRNSSSCPMLWPLVYEGREAEIRASVGEEKAAALLGELALVTRLTERVADLFTATGMELSSRHIEPLQLVRYQPSETFMPHHDYHEPGPDGSLGSSVQGEQRAFTVLLFGATMPAEAGGETHFPHLGVEVTPRKGDALVWANVDGEGAPNPRSLHEGRPPSSGEKVAVNVWVAEYATCMCLSALPYTQSLPRIRRPAHSASHALL